MQTIKNSDKVDDESLKFYEGIDGLFVIEEFLKFKGVKLLTGNPVVAMKQIEDMALIAYSLKPNATNKLYALHHLHKSLRKHGLIMDSGRVKIPLNLYQKYKH